MLEHDPDDHPETAHLGDAIAGPGELGEPLDDVGADPLGVLQNAVLLERIDYGERRCARDGISAEGRAVAAGGEARRDVGARDHRSDRKPAAERLGQRYDIGLDPHVLKGKEAAGAAHPGLHFVEDEQNPLAIAEVADALEVIGLRNDHPALALDRLDHHRDGLIAKRTIQRGQVVEWREPEAGHERLKALVVFLLAGCAQRRQRAAVKRTECGHDLEPAAAVLVAPSARELDRRLVGLGAGIAEERAAVAEPVCKPLGQSRHRLGVEHVRDVSELLGLFLDRAHDAGMTMPEARHGKSAEEIQVAISIRVVQVRAVAANECERQASVDIDEIAMREFDDFRVVHPGPISSLSGPPGAGPAAAPLRA